MITPVLIKSALKRTINNIGWDVRRYVAPEAECAHLAGMLSFHNVNLVFDIGANTGQFARALREAGYKHRIVSFEALESAWKELNAASRADDLWVIAARGIVGAEDGEADFHVSTDSQCSSVLDMHDAVLQIVPSAAYIATERIPMRKLDTIGKQYVHNDSVLFIKADVQGFESQVIKGACELLLRAAGIYLELTLVPLYRGQSLFDELIAELKCAGFALWDFKPEYFDPRSGRMIWGTGVFFRP